MAVATGTSHFTSFASAVWYYRPYGYSTKDVQSKLDEGEISIGEPLHDPEVERLIVLDGRYAIVKNDFPDQSAKGEKLY